MEEESCCVPPGFRFHPTEEELVGYYLARKVASQKIDLDIIQEVDLYRMEPWDLQERCKKQLGGDEEQTTTTEWYFFSYKDRKYPSGTRTNRATAAGFWKATGRDKPVLRSSAADGSRSRVIGMRKTLVFYMGRAPHGRKTEWIMHEYRLQNSNEHVQDQQGWVVCRAFHKPLPNLQQRPPGCYILRGQGSSYYYSAAAPATDAVVLPQAQLEQLPCYAAADDHLLFESKNLFSIPPLQSPTAISHGYQQQRCNTAIRADDHDEQQAAAAIDWNFLDSLLQSTTSDQLHDPTSSLPRADYY